MRLTGTTAEDLARAARRRTRFAWMVVCGLVLAIGLGSFAYKPWRLKSLQRASREAIGKGDYSRASFYARRALQLDPDFFPACVTMAEVGERTRMPDAVIWRERIVHLKGETADSLLGLAATALSFSRIATARTALERVPAKDREREDFLVLTGAIALEAREYPKSARLYEAALRLNPGKVEYRFALGTAKCAAEDASGHEEGRRLLLELSTHPTLGAAALRAVITNSESHQDYATALRYAQQLIALPSHKYADELLLLGLIRKTAPGDFPAKLAEAQQAAQSNLRNAGALLLWMSLEAMAEEGLEWVVKRTPKLGQSPELRPAMAGCYLTQMDWSALLLITQKSGWAAVEYVRHAYRARAFRERAAWSLADTEWNLAINAAGGQVDALTWLAQMSSEWKWTEETTQCLWALLDKNPGLPWAVEALQKSYLERENTAGLRQVALHLVNADPANADARNDLALASILLHIEADRALKIARDLHVKYPDNAAFNSTYAFALHSTGRTAEGLEVLEKLPLERLEDPTIAAYYGIMLAANYAGDKASRFLKIGRTGTLLPEERRLIDQAEEAIANPEP